MRERHTRRTLWSSRHPACTNSLQTGRSRTILSALLSQMSGSQAMPVSCAYLLWQEHLQDTVIRCRRAWASGSLFFGSSCLEVIISNAPYRRLIQRIYTYSAHLHQVAMNIHQCDRLHRTLQYLTIFPARMWCLNWSCDDTLTVSSRGSMTTQTIYSTRARYVAKSAVGWWYFKWDMLLPCFFKFPCNNKCLLKG
jgi:hypothetical protein